MIYLIMSPAYTDNSCTKYEDILKIGYTSEDSRKSRFNIYLTENPTIKILYLIPNGTEQDEYNLHQYFKKYWKYGREWFSFESEIIEYFESHKTAESLKDLKTYRSDRKNTKFNKDRNRLLKELNVKYINKVLSNTEDTTKYPEIIESSLYKIEELLENELDIDSIDNYFKSTYPDIDFTKELSLSIEVKTEIQKIESENYQNFTDKMKYIYSLDYNSDFMKLILDNLTDPSFAKYYYSILKERASALKFQKGNLEKEYKSVKSFSVNFNVIINEIRDKFKVGERYSKSYIKDTIKSIYESNGYNKTHKANDLEEYFELKLCKVTDKITGKIDNGFFIVKEKLKNKMEEDN